MCGSGGGGGGSHGGSAIGHCGYQEHLAEMKAAKDDEESSVRRGEQLSVSYLPELPSYMPIYATYLVCMTIYATLVFTLLEKKHYAPFLAICTQQQTSSFFFTCQTKLKYARIIF